MKFYQVRISYLYILVCTKDMPLYTGIYQSVQYIPVYTVLIPIYSCLYTVYTGIYQVSAEFSGYVVLYFLTIFILSYASVCTIETVLNVCVSFPGKSSYMMVKRVMLVYILVNTLALLSLPSYSLISLES